MCEGAHQAEPDAGAAMGGFDEQVFQEDVGAGFEGAERIVEQRQTDRDAANIGQDRPGAGQGAEQGFVEFGFCCRNVQMFVRGQSADQAQDGRSVYGYGRADDAVTGHGAKPEVAVVYSFR